jgi:hypothetical protein
MTLNHKLEILWRKVVVGSVELVYQHLTEMAEEITKILG